MSTAVARVAAAVLIACMLAACASIGGPKPQPIPPYQPIDNGVPALDVAQALTMLNALRRSAGAGPVIESPALSATAKDMASVYALTGEPKSRPAGVLHMRFAAGLVTFDAALAAWRAAPNGDASLVNRAVTKVGIGSVVFDGTGAYWVLLLG